MEGSFWACARLEHNHERLGLDSLTRNGFEPYYPRVREHRRLRTGRKIIVTPALFYGYCFIVVRLQFHAARRSPGVLGLIMDGLRPAKVPDTVIAEIKGRERFGLIELPPPSTLQIGDAVRITGGAFAGLTGLVSGMKANERVELLLGLLGRLTLPVADVERVGG
jgi:transcriptional antiterminator RfaH